MALLQLPLFNFLFSILQVFNRFPSVIELAIVLPPYEVLLLARHLALGNNSFNLILLVTVIQGDWSWSLWVSMEMLELGGVEYIVDLSCLR
jgi:hypothetical protein